MPKLPLIKKNIERFLSSEEGKISQKSIIDLGIGVTTLSLLIGRLMPPQNVVAFTDHVNCHTNCHTNCHDNCSHINCHNNCHTNCHTSGGCGCGICACGGSCTFISH